LPSGAAVLAIGRRSSFWYSYLTRRLTEDALFFNWSYEEDPPMGLPLDAGDEPNRYPIQLYHSTATQNGGLAGTRVLEVGCGRGGGGSYLTRALTPASYVGLDLDTASIEFCRCRHPIPGLKFVRGDAENLPFPLEAFDAVINVESSHCYPYFDRFLAEVARVLRPGGMLLYADLRWRYECAQWEAMLGAAPRRVVSWREINAEVSRGMERNSAQWQAMADGLVPRFVRPSRHGPANPAIMRNLNNGRTQCRMYYLTKNESHGGRMDHPDDYIFYARPAEVWAVEFRNLVGDCVVEVLGTEFAARQAAELYGEGAAVLLRSSTDFHPVSDLSHPDAAPRSSA
jgi:SAM-dependent methyltransferase